MPSRRRCSGQGSPPPGAEVELNILVGDAKAGQAYFASKCGSCHSPEGDLKGIGEKVGSPLALQNHWITGGGRGGRGNGERKPVMATVTPASGAKVEGRLDRIDDFIVVLTTADGMQRSFRGSATCRRWRFAIRSRGIGSC